MVAVLHSRPQDVAPEAIAHWLATLRASYAAEDVRAIEEALDFARERCANLTTRDGEALAERAIGTATILAGLRLDPASIRAALLMGLPYADQFDPRDLVTRFGQEVAELVHGVARMDEIRAETDAAGIRAALTQSNFA